jgi:hypothetical protein
MKQGRTLGYVTIWMALLLAAQTSVYANHFIAGGGRYSVPMNTSEISVRCQFLGVLTGLPDAATPVIETHIQCAILPPDSPTPFRLFTSGTEVNPFTVVEDSETQHTITITGKMLSRFVSGVEPDDQHLTEIVSFEVNAVDAAFPGAGMDSMTLRLDYRATEDTAPLLLDAFGPDLMVCNADVCTLTLTGVLTEGEIESHTSGGE